MDIEPPKREKPYGKPGGERRGLLIVNTGNGKGKTTAAIGLAVRALGRYGWIPGIPAQPGIEH